MSERVTIRLNEGLRARLSEAAKARGLDLSAVVRQAVIAALDGSHGTTPTAPPVHDREACAWEVLKFSSPAVQARMAGAMERTGVSLLPLLSIMLKRGTDATRTPPGVDA